MRKKSTLIFKQLKHPEKRSFFFIICPEKALILPARKSPEFGSKKGPVGTLTQMHKILDYVCPYNNLPITLVAFSEHGSGSLHSNSSVPGAELTESRRKSKSVTACVVFSPSGVGPWLHLNQLWRPLSAPTWIKRII